MASINLGDAGLLLVALLLAVWGRVALHGKALGTK